MTKSTKSSTGTVNSEFLFLHTITESAVPIAGLDSEIEHVVHENMIGERRKHTKAAVPQSSVN